MISSSGTDGGRRNTPTFDPTVQTERNRTLHEHHVSTNTSSRPGRQRTTHVHAGGSHGHGSLNYFTVWNVQGLKPRTVPTKVPFVQDLLKDRNQIFMALTETWLREHNDAELQVDGYTLFRQDRQRLNRRRGRDSGGVAVYLRDDMAADVEPVIGFSNGVDEILGLYSKSKSLLLVVIYRQPDDIVGGHRSTHTEFRQVLVKLTKVLSTISSPMPEVLVCGDFNLPHAIWPEGTAGLRSTRDEQTMLRDLKDVANEWFLIQQIELPTHRKGNTLDLVFSNDPLFVHSQESLDTMYSDHNIVECATTYMCDTDSTHDTHDELSPTAGHGFDDLNYFSEDTDWSGLEQELHFNDWSMEFRSLQPQDMLSRFIDICLNASAKHVPVKRRNAGLRSNSRIPRYRKNLMRRRRRIAVQLQKVTSENRRKKLMTEARDIEKKLQKSYRETRDINEQKAVDAIKTNSKYFFSYAKKFSKVVSGIGPLMDSAKTLVTSPTQMAEMLSTQYSSVFSEPKEEMEDPEDLFPDGNYSESWIHNVAFDQEDIVNAINEISHTAAAGPDRFPAILLKHCRNTLALPLYLIWRKSLDCGIIPQLLKTANIVPIHKGKSRGDPANYRPVALTSHLIKLFEKILKKHIVAYMEENNLFNPGQHGFRLGRSCLSQLIAHYDHITRLLESGQNVDVIYIDFAKAFDKVDYLVTMKKLKGMGISGKLGRWLHAFLTNRKQAVVVNGTKSMPADVKSGVPQGSVLGPLLFLVLIGDIDREVTTSFVSSFC